MSAGYGSHNSGYAGGYRDAGDVPTHVVANPTAMDALASAIALPGVFTPAEMHRTLQRNRMDVMKTALQLREKHALRQSLHYDDLNIGLQTLQTELTKGYVHVLENAYDPHKCPIVLLQVQFFKPSFSSAKLALQGGGAIDGSSSLEDTRRLCVYIMDLAVEVMEENHAEGVVFLVDLDNCSVANVETKLVTDVLTLVKRWYPNTVRYVLVLNGNAVTRTLTHALAKLAGDKTQQRLRVLSHVNDLRTFLHLPSIPQMYGGTYTLQRPAEWIRQQAAIEDVDLIAAAAPALNEQQQYLTKDAQQLHGMQYAGCSVEQVSAMAASTTTIRGPLYRCKNVGTTWPLLYGILRPDALLLYLNQNGTMPQFIVPVNYEVVVTPATVADAPRGASAFRIDVPGVAGGHLLAAATAAERANWLDAIERTIYTSRNAKEQEEREEEIRLTNERAFAALNMISFDEVAPTPTQTQTLTPTQNLTPTQTVAFQAQYMQPPLQQQQTRIPTQTQNLMPQTPFVPPPQPLQQQQQLQPYGVAQLQSPPTGNFVMAPSVQQHQQFNLVAPLVTGSGTMMNPMQQQQQLQQLVRPPQPVTMPLMPSMHMQATSGMIQQQPQQEQPLMMLPQQQQQQMHMRPYQNQQQLAPYQNQMHYQQQQPQFMNPMHQQQQSQFQHQQQQPPHQQQFFPAGATTTTTMPHYRT